MNNDDKQIKTKINKSAICPICDIECSETDTYSYGCEHFVRFENDEAIFEKIDDIKDEEKIEI